MANVIEFRHPASRFAVTLRVGGGGSPFTPLIRTRSGTFLIERMVSKRATASGLR